MEDLQEKLNEMSYDDIAFLLLRQYDKKMKTQTLYKKICKLLDVEFKEENLADFYELLAVNKKFVFVNGYWSLQTKHKLCNNNEEEDPFCDIDFEEDYEEEKLSEEDFYEELIDDSEDDNDEDDDISGFIIDDDLDEE